MAFSAVPFDSAIKGQYDGSHAVDFPGDTLKVSLHTAAYTPNRATHEFFDDVTNEVSAGSGYTAGGETLTGVVVTIESGHVICIDADDVEWVTLTKTFRYAVIYKDTGTPSSSPLIGYVDFGASQVITAANFPLAWQPVPDGVLSFEVT